jgi:hypothetical protein
VATSSKREHPEARKWRLIAQRYQRQVQDMLFELGRVSVELGDSVTVSLNPQGSWRDDVEVIPCAANCGVQIRKYTSYGRPRNYCSTACRARAYRSRVKLRVAGG